MIPAGVQIFMALEPIDMRCGFPRLSGIAREQLGYDPRCGALFVFYGKRRDALKILFFDGTGWCLFYKRLERGRFRIPESSDSNATSLELEEHALDALCEFRRHLGAVSDRTWAAVPAAPGQPFRSTWAAIPEHLGSRSGAPGQPYRSTWAAA